MSKSAIEAMERLTALQALGNTYCHMARKFTVRSGEAVDLAASLNPEIGVSALQDALEAGMFLGCFKTDESLKLSFEMDAVIEVSRSSRSHSWPCFVSNSS